MVKKNIFVALVLITIANICLAQGAAANKDPLYSIALSPYLSEKLVNDMPLEAQQTLELKLRQMTDLKSIGGINNPRFILTAVVNVISKDIVPTAPPMIALGLNVNFFIGDGEKGKIFATKTKVVKGVGTNDIKAYNNAINNIVADDSEIQRFVEVGKQKVVEYFTTRCDEVINQADLYAAANNYDYALYWLMLVPEECKECFNRCLDKVREIVPKRSKYNCTHLLLKAKAQWASSLDEHAANMAAATLDEIGIDLNAECHKEIKAFIAEVSTTMRERNNREWDYKEKTQENKIELAEDMIDIYKREAVEYSRSHPPAQSYNINNWR